MSAAKPGDVIAGRYRIEAPVGSGAYASVFRARDETLARAVAIKFLYLSDERKREVMAERFLREARIAAAVDHPNVARTFDFGAEADRPYMVMELLQGQSLGERMERGAIPLGELVDLACEILAGLDAIHRAGIVHRDLKPDNVILASDGLAERARIVDFGVSRALPGAGDVRSALTTRDGLVVGTPEYMSPEQARGLGEIDARADIYAMGAILYEALTGRLPYRASNMADLIVAIAGGGAPSVHRLRPEVSEALSAVVERAMALAPEDRFASAGDMVWALLAATERSAPSPGSWLPPRTDARPTLNEFAGPPAQVATSGASLPGLHGSVPNGGVLLDAAIRDARLGESDASREAARAPTLEASPDSFPPRPPRAPQAPSHSPAPATAPSPYSVPASGMPGPPAPPAPSATAPPRGLRPTPPLSSLRPRHATPSDEQASTAPPPPPPPGAPARARRQTPPAVPDALASMRPRRATPSGSAPLLAPAPAASTAPPGPPARPRGQTPPAVPEPPMSLASMRPRRETPPAPSAPAPAPPTAVQSRAAPPPVRPPLATIESQLQEARGDEPLKLSTLAIARLPGMRRPGMASNRPRVGIARSNEPRPRRSLAPWLLLVIVALAASTLWLVASRPDARATLDGWSRTLGRVSPVLSPYLPFRRTVEVTLVGVPQSARIRLDGTLIPSDIFEVPRDGALHLVEVEMRGMETWRATFEGQADRSFGVVLVEREGPGGRRNDSFE